jgi:hypothetical protein
MPPTLVTYPISSAGGTPLSSRAMILIWTFFMPGFSSKHVPLATTVPATLVASRGVWIDAVGLSRSRSMIRAYAGILVKSTAVTP